jgi:hypothetical protein
MKTAGLGLTLGLIVGLVAMTAHAEQRDAAFYIAPRIGRGDIHIRARANVNEVNDNVGAVYFGVTGGWISPIGLMAEIGRDTESNFDWFTAEDRFTLDHTYAMLGWEVPLGDVWRLVPKFGRSKWTLKSKEGAFLHPGPEDVKKIRGYENIWELELGGKVSESIVLGTAYRNHGYDFGSANAVMFVAKFEF